jgi:hypothetical protein
MLGIVVLQPPSPSARTPKVAATQGRKQIRVIADLLEACGARWALPTAAARHGRPRQSVKLPDIG